jgi:hypothetical protein
MARVLGKRRDNEGGVWSMRREHALTIAACTAGLLLCTTAASAEDWINLIPSYPISMVNAPAGNNAPELLTDRSFPAGAPFRVRLPIDEPGQVTAKFEIWPLEDASSCAKPNTASPQYQKIGMSAGKSGEDNYVEANVGRLQVDTSYCYRVTGTTRLARPILRALAHRAADSIIRSVEFASAQDKVSLPTAICTAEITAELFAKVFGEALEKERLVGTTDGAAKLAYAYWYGGSSDNKNPEGPTRCEDYVGAVRKTVEKDTIDDQIKETLAKLDKPELDLTDNSAPLVAFKKADGVFELLPADGEPCLADDKIDLCIAQLDRRRKLSNWVAVWIDKLKELKPLKADQRKTKLEATRPSIPQNAADRPLEIHIGDGAFIKYRTYIVTIRNAGVNAVSVQPIEVARQLGLLPLRSPGTDVKLQQDYLKKLAELQKMRGDVEKAKAAALAERVTQRTALKTALVEAFAAEDGTGEKARGTRHLLNVEFGLKANQGQGGHNATPDPKNYGSIDLGILAAAPFSGGVDPWIIPYVGANIYFGSVDRSVGFDSMVGNSWQRMRQRISLTIGTSLTAPGVTGRATEGVILGRYPLVSLGFRTTQYTRMGIGALFYRLHDNNPASSDVSLRAAPFVSFSLDLDLINFFAGEGGVFSKRDSKGGT